MLFIERKRQIRNSTLIIGLLFLLPAIIAMIVFRYYPIIKALGMSFFEYKTVLDPGKFIWLENYKTIFSTDLFWKAWGNTIVYYLFSVLFGFFICIVQAVLLQQIKRGQGLFRVFYMIPVIVPAVVGFFLWKWIYKPGPEGGLNMLLATIGINPIGWLNDPSLAKISLTLPYILGGGIYVLIYLAAIEGIPGNLYEAGEIDGLNEWTKITCITLPSIVPMIKISFILFTIYCLQVFDQPFIMTGGGPQNETTLSTLLVYRYAFQQYRFGLANASAMIIFIIILILTVIQIILKKEEN